MSESLVGRALIIGVDRLDYSKGCRIASRLSIQLMGALARASLARHVMQWRRRRADRWRSTGTSARTRRPRRHVNGKYAEFDWVPIRYLNKTFSRNALAGFYRMARIGLVTPLRDGMNLVAKEYVAAQTATIPACSFSPARRRRREMEGALIVNPFDVEAMAEAFASRARHAAGERQKALAGNDGDLRRNNVGKWREDFLRALREETQTQAAA